MPKATGRMKLTDKHLYDMSAVVFPALNRATYPKARQILIVPLSFASDSLSQRLKTVEHRMYYIDRFDDFEKNVFEAAC